MARWDPDAKARLRAAAVELFLQHGYEAVTVTQIAEHAGLTRRSFFRYFPDKREVLFDGSDRMSAALTDAVAGADASLTPAQAVLTAARDIGVAVLEQVMGTRERREIIAKSPELQERERTKAAAVADAVAAGLEERGVPLEDARLLGRVAGDLLGEAFQRAIDDEKPLESFLGHLDAVVSTVAGFASIQVTGAR
jgi:AcrR family transcriptional regulator